jgi:hypothetical protein
MKSLLLFLLGAVIGAFGYSLYIAREAKPLPHASVAAPAPTPPAAPRTFGEKAADTTNEIKDTLAEKAKDWHLTPDDIKRELQQGGKIVREKAAVAGGKIADARIVTVIKSKYVLDRELSALDINVDCTEGKVTLTGALASVDLVSKATLLAMDTDGVVHVTSNLTAPH